MQITSPKFTVIEALKTLGMIVLVLIATAVILFIWAQLSMVVWHCYGFDTFVFWLLGSVLALLLTLVVVW